MCSSSMPQPRRRVLLADSVATEAGRQGAACGGCRLELEVGCQATRAGAVAGDGPGRAGESKVNIFSCIRRLLKTHSERAITTLLISRSLIYLYE